MLTIAISPIGNKTVITALIKKMTITNVIFTAKEDSLLFTGIKIGKKQKVKKISELFLLTIMKLLSDLIVIWPYKFDVVS